MTGVQTCALPIYMSFKRFVLATACAGCLLGPRFVAYAQFTNYFSDIRTTPDATTAVNVVRLFKSGFLTGVTNDPAPVGTVVWFVGDVSGNGVNTNLAGVGPVSPHGSGPGGVLDADDQILWFDAVDGVRAGDNPGTLARLPSGPFPTNASYLPIYAFVWSFTNAMGQIPGNVSGTGFAAPGPGDSFGVFPIGVRTPDYQGGFNTTTWFIFANTFADQFTVVPEPSLIALGSLGLVGLVCHRRFRIPGSHTG